MQVAIVLLGALVWVLAWSTIGLKKKYMFASQYLFWVQGCFHTLMFSLARMTSSHNFILCGSSTGSKSQYLLSNFFHNSGAMLSQESGGF